MYFCIGIVLGLDDDVRLWYYCCMQVGPLEIHGDTTSIILVVYQLIRMVCVLLAYVM